MPICSNCFTEKGSTPFCPYCGYRETENTFDANRLQQGEIVKDKYIVGRILGVPGRFGFTYMAKDLSLDRCVAIKEFFPLDLAKREADGKTVTARNAQFHEVMIRFLKEARISASFNHPNIVRVNEIFEENCTAYLVMDYVDGFNLLEYAETLGGQINEKRLQEIMLPILDGLDTIHKAGVVHLDIKPQNIYISKDGPPMLLDFGAAEYLNEAREDSMIVLTPGFAPFEQYVKEEKLGPWTDIYACAATMYALLSGKVPQSADKRNEKDTLEDIQELVPGISPGLGEIIMRSLSTNVNNRPQTISELQKGFCISTDLRQGRMGSSPTALIPKNYITQVMQNFKKDDNQPKQVFTRVRISILACLLVIAVIAGGYYYHQNVSNPLHKLSQKGIDFNEDAFVAAISRGDLEVVKLFLNAGMNPDAKNVNGRTALAEAISQGNLDIVKLLTGKGVNYDVKDHSGNGIFELAIKQSKPEIFEYLFSQIGEDANSKDSSGVTWLERALRVGNIEIAKWLVQKGSDINVTNEDGSTLLDRIVAQGNANSIAFLKSLGAKRNVNRLYKQGQLTIVKDGSSNNSKKTFEIDFLDNGDVFQIETADSRDKTITISQNDREVLELINNGDRDYWYVCYPWENAKPVAIYLATGGSRAHVNAFKVIGDKGNGQIGVLYESSLFEASNPHVSFIHNNITLDYVVFGLFRNRLVLSWNEAARVFEAH